MKQYDNLEYHLNKYLEVFPEDKYSQDLLLLINSKEDDKQTNFLNSKQLIKLFNNNKLISRF